MTGKDSLKVIMHSVWIRSVKAEIRTKVKLTSPGLRRTCSYDGFRQVRETLDGLRARLCHTQEVIVFVCFTPVSGL